MEKNRKQKLLLVIALVTAITSLSIGFAAFSTTLNISSTANVTPNSETFSVKFSIDRDSLEVTPVSPSYSGEPEPVATEGIINNTTNPTLTNLSATFTRPGQTVEYLFYTRNEGEYTAYLNSVNYVGDKVCEATGDANNELVQRACEDINVIVYIGDSSEKFTETTEISNHPLEKQQGEPIIIQIAYSSTGDSTLADGDFRINLPDIALVYSTIDDPSYAPTPDINSLPGKLYKKIASLSLGNDKDINLGEDTQSGVFQRNNTINNEYPVYYYRGTVTNNNVLFAEKCWKIVRTTETGGVKIIYNGDISDGNTCHGENSTIGESQYNPASNLERYVTYYSPSYDNTIKNYIDGWFSANMIPYQDKLEDTVWCNDRSTYYDSGESIQYQVSNRNGNKTEPTLACPSYCSLTKSTTSTNQKLLYPVGLITADEMTLAGAGWLTAIENNYLSNGTGWWTMSPWMYEVETACVVYVTEAGFMDFNAAEVYLGVRPAISLQQGIEITTGNGSSTAPFVIE